MELHLDDAGGQPPFEQLRAAIVQQVSSGALLPGERLPTVRGLAEQLALAPGTVARAYRELEADAIIETRGRAGTFVAAAADPAERAATDAAHAYAERIHRLGVSGDRAVELVVQALRVTSQRGSG